MVATTTKAYGPRQVGLRFYGLRTAASCAGLAYSVLLLKIPYMISRASFFNRVSFFVKSRNGVIFARILDRKSQFHILNLIGH